MGSDPPKKKVITIFLAARPFFEHFWKNVYVPFENPKTLRKISKNWCWKGKISCTLLQMLVIPRKMTAGPELDRIIQFSKILRIAIIRLLKMNEYRIVLFSLNYSNTKYLKSNSSPPKNFKCKFCDQMRCGKFDALFSYLHEGFLVCFLHILLIKNSRTIWYLVTTIWVFKYYLEITNGPNTEHE